MSGQKANGNILIIFSHQRNDKPNKVHLLYNDYKTKSSRRYGATGILIHYWWECKVLQPHWKSVFF